jgi:hypothetical protein
MSLFSLKPTHKPVKDYYAALAQFHKHGHTTGSSCADLLERCLFINATSSQDSN